MKILTKPKPNEKFFTLTLRQASLTAMEVARRYGNGEPDWQLFKEWTEAHARRNRTSQLSLV